MNIIKSFSKKLLLCTIVVFSLVSTSGDDHFTGTDGDKHTGMGNNTTIANRVPALLDGPLSNFSIPKNPNIQTRGAASEQNASVSPRGQKEMGRTEPSPLPEGMDLIADKTEVLPGGYVTFTASSSKGALTDVELWCPTLWNTGEQSAWLMEKSGNVFQYTVKVPDELSEVFEFRAFSRINGELNTSPIVNILSKPMMSDLNEIKLFNNNGLVVYNINEKATLRVKGIFNDGREFDLSHPSLGTTYYSTSPDIAAVTPYGKVWTLSPGYTDIKIRNMDHEFVHHVKVISIDWRMPANKVVGTSGNDSITGTDVDDIITGGPGNDRLEGGDWDDTYIWNMGDGNNTIFDNSGSNVLQLGEGISPSGVSLACASADGGDLIVILPGGGSVTIEGWFDAEENQLSEIRFADGTVWTRANINGMNAFLEGTEIGETISGTTTNDAIYEFPMHIIAGSTGHSPEEIDLSVNATEVIPGGSITFTASSNKGELKDVYLVSGMLWQLGEESSWVMEETEGVFKCSVTLPYDLSGVVEFTALGRIKGEPNSSPKVPITVKPIMRDLRGIRLRSDNSNHRTSNVRIRHTLWVIGLFNDGREYDISHPNLGTTYHSTSPDVATVTPYGEVETLSPGYTEIKIKNQDFENILYLKVISKDPELINTSDDVTPSSDDTVGTSGQTTLTRLQPDIAGVKS
jgi:Ca2+-binding RTX toxin-like protein